MGQAWLHGLARVVLAVPDGKLFACQCQHHNEDFLGLIPSLTSNNMSAERPGFDIIVTTLRGLLTLVTQQRRASSSRGAVGLPHSPSISRQASMHPPKPLAGATSMPSMHSYPLGPLQSGQRQHSTGHDSDFGSAHSSFQRSSPSLSSASHSQEVRRASLERQPHERSSREALRPPLQQQRLQPAPKPLSAASPFASAAVLGSFASVETSQDGDDARSVVSEEEESAATSLTGSPAQPSVVQDATPARLQQQWEDRTRVPHAPATSNGPAAAAAQAARRLSCQSHRDEPGNLQAASFGHAQHDSPSQPELHPHATSAAGPRVLDSLRKLGQVQNGAEQPVANGAEGRADSWPRQALASGRGSGSGSGTGSLRAHSPVSAAPGLMLQGACIACSIEIAT